MWIPRYQIKFQKVVDSWMDLLDYCREFTEVKYLQWVEAQNNMIRQQQNAMGIFNPMLYDPNHPETLANYNDRLAEVHRAKIPHQ